MVTKRGTNAADTLIGAAAALLVILAGDAEAATKIGTAGNDTINGTASADILAGRAGNDTLNGLGGADKVYGDTENDRLFGGDGNDQVYGGPGNDALDGGNGDDRLEGQEDRDVLRGGAGNDVLVDDGIYDYEPDLLYGGPGSDTLSVGHGAAYGGDGNDRISFCGGSAYGEAGGDILQPYAGCHYTGDGYATNGGGTVRGGPGADTLDFTTPVCGEMQVNYVGWEPGIDKITGQLWSWDFPPDVPDNCGDAIPVPLGGVREYLLKHFDRNRDKHISKADGPTFLANGPSLTFPVDPSTGKQSLDLRVANSRLYLAGVTTLF